MAEVVNNRLYGVDNRDVTRLLGDLIAEGTLFSLGDPNSDGVLTAKVASFNTPALSGASYTPASASDPGYQIIPAGALVLGVTAHVLTAVTGPTTFDIGDGTTADKFVANMAVALDTKKAALMVPVAYAAATSIVVTKDTTDFTGGVVRISVFYLVASAPPKVA